MAIFSDDFNRANEILSSGSWEIGRNQGVAIESNQVRGGGGADASFVAVSTFAELETQEVTFTLNATGDFDDAYAMARSTATGNGYMVGYLADGLGIIAYRLDSWATTQIGWQLASVSVSDSVGIDVSGSTIKMLHNGTQVGSDITDTNHTSGQVGIYYSRGNNGSTYVDDFSVTDGAAAGPTLTGPDSTTENAATVTTGTLLDTISTLRLTTTYEQANRNFVQLDPVLNSYYELANAISFTGDFVVEVDFAINKAGANNNLILLGDFLIRVQSDTSIRVWTDISVTQASFVVSALGSKLHTLRVKGSKLSKNVELILDGVSYGVETTTSTPSFTASTRFIGRYSSSYFGGIIANARFIDLSGAAPVVTTFALNEETGNTELSQESRLGDNNWLDTGSFIGSVGVAEGNTVTLEATTGYGQYSLLSLGITGGPTLISFRVDGSVGNNVVINLEDADGNSDLVVQPLRFGDGEHTYLCSLPSLKVFRLRLENAGQEVTISNISVREVSGNAITYVNAPASIRDKYTLTDGGWRGVNIVSNGDFSEGSVGWDGSTGTIENGVAKMLASNEYIQQQIDIINGTTVEVSYTVIESGSPTLYLSSTGFGGASLSIPRGVGSHSVSLMVMDASLPLRFIHTSSTLCSISDISVKRIIEVAP